MPTNLLSAVECKNATSKGAGIRKLHEDDGLYLWVYLDGPSIGASLLAGR
ncbi:MAG: hypothetical protein KGQ58_02225 [Proteobacteria bacterium]|nr:hypothetical protein [Pseudomonadota bacterium]MDE3207374.1 hypothetical protein [Pseudomonadota bacterium]